MITTKWIIHGYPQNLDLRKKHKNGHHITERERTQISSNNPHLVGPEEAKESRGFQGYCLVIEVLQFDHAKFGNLGILCSECSGVVGYKCTLFLFF